MARRVRDVRDTAKLTCVLHPTIPLELQNSAPYETNSFVCDLCCKTSDGPTYHCKTCKYDLHPQCCILQPQLRTTTHPHPLTLHAGSATPTKKKACDACRTSLADGGEWCYRCELCDFEVHAGCAKLREKLLTSFHPFPLKLLKKSPYPPRHLQCDFCDERMATNAWVYHCTNCKFDLHPRCALFPQEPLCLAVHPHRLRHCQYKTFHGKSYVCAVCLEFGGDLGFRCEPCDFDVHPKCLKIFFSNYSPEPVIGDMPKYKVTAYGVHVLRNADAKLTDEDSKTHP